MSDLSFKPLAPHQLKDQAYVSIKDAITSLRFQPGAAIVEGQLAQRLGTSKTPIRMALVRLEHEGFVETRRASGTFVRRMTFDDVREIFEVRLALEQCAVSTLAESATPRQLALLRTNINRAARLVRQPQSEATFDAVNEFHLALVDSVGNHWLSHTYRTLFDHIVRIGNVCGRIPGRNEASLREHHALVELLAARDSAGAHQALAEHVASVLADYGASASSNQLLQQPGDAPP